MSITRQLSKGLIKLGLYPHLPSSIRYTLARNNQQQYKQQNLTKLGIKEYIQLYDNKACYDLNERFQTGTCFKGDTVLDVGCGPRGILGVVKAKHKIGVDPSLNSLPLECFDIPDNTTYISKPAEELSSFIHRGTMDVCACINTLNHVQDPGKVLSEIYKVLKPGGRLLFECYLQPYAPGHPWSFTCGDLAELLLYDNNFEPLYQYMYPWMIHPVSGEPCSPAWGGVFQK